MNKRYAFQLVAAITFLLMMVAQEQVKPILAAVPQCPNGLFAIPSEGTLGWPYLYPESADPLMSPVHTGIDIFGTTADDVYAVYDGVVTQRSDPRIWIKHGELGGIETFYSHLSVINVNVGDRVTRGQVIGKKGNVGTGPVHLHFSIKADGTDERYLRNTVDPSLYLGANLNYEHGATPHQRTVAQWCNQTNTSTYVEVAVDIYDIHFPYSGYTVKSIAPDKYNPQPAQRNLEVKLTNSSNVSYSRKVIANYNKTRKAFIGKVDFGSTFTSGPYVMQLKLDYTLPKNLLGIYTIRQGKSYAIHTVPVKNGNADNNTQINILDYNILLNCLNNTGCSPGSSSYRGADLDANGKVEISDFNFLLRVIQNGNDGN